MLWIFSTKMRNKSVVKSMGFLSCKPPLLAACHEATALCSSHWRSNCGAFFIFLSTLARFALAVLSSCLASPETGRRVGHKRIDVPRPFLAWSRTASFCCIRPSASCRHMLRTPLLHKLLVPASLRTVTIHPRSAESCLQDAPANIDVAHHSYWLQMLLRSHKSRLKGCSAWES